jgi:GNAT superfamily N-acetyltransferase
MLVRRAKRSDIDGILEVWKEHMDFHSEIYPLFARAEDGHVRFAEFLSKHWNDPDWALFVADEEGAIVGYCLATILDYPPVFHIRNFGFIQDMAVSAEFRRRGIGTELLERLVVWFKEQGVRRVELQALIGNEVSQSFWSKRGFAQYLSRFARNIT